MTIQFYNGKPQKIYNVNYSKLQYVTVGDLENYARTDSNNYFYYFNFFNSIRVKTINDISGDIFTYFSNLSENIQAFINSTKLTLTNVSYENNTTTINNNLTTLAITCTDIENQYTASTNINVSKLNTDKITAISIKSNQINCNSLKCKTLEFENDIGVYLYLNNLTIPLNKTLGVSDLNFSDAINTVKVSIKPNYTISFYNNNYLLSTYSNTTKSIRYFIPVNRFQGFTTIKIYFKNIILL